MIYSKDQLELRSTIGQGVFHVIFFKCKQQLSCIISGESGLVYKGYIKTSIGKELVAIKTGKGMNILLVHATNFTQFFQCSSIFQV